MAGEVWDRASYSLVPLACLQCSQQISFAQLCPFPAVDNPQNLCLLAHVLYTAPPQKVKLQPHWQSLDAELDRCWAAHSVAEEVTATVDDSWDQSEASSTATPTLDSFPGRDSVPDALWPSLAARPAAYSSTPGQQAWLQDLSQVRCAYVMLTHACGAYPECGGAHRHCQTVCDAHCQQCYSLC